MNRREYLKEFHAKRRERISQMPEISCGCGCGEMISPVTSNLKPRTYAAGHHPNLRNSQGRTPWNKIGDGLTAAEKTKRHRERRYKDIAKLPKIPCACGCGKEIPPINRGLKPAKYAHGHNPEGQATQFQKGRRYSGNSQGNPNIARVGTATRFKKGQEAWNKGKAGPSGINSPTWKGGEWNVNGYVRCTITPAEARKHPTALNHGSLNYWSIQRSHIVWGKAFPNDRVQQGEHIHHINKKRDDDHIENLRKMGHAEHISMHRKATKIKRGDTGRFT